MWDNYLPDDQKENVVNDKKIIVIKNHKELYELIDKRLDDLEKRLEKLENYSKWLCGYDLLETEIF